MRQADIGSAVYLRWVQLSAILLLLLTGSCNRAGAQSVSWQEVDVGGASTAGSFAYTAGSPPTFTVVGSGHGFQNAYDQYGFAQVTTAGNTEISGQLVSQSSSLTGANSGLVMRDSLDVNAGLASIGVTVGSGIQFFYRTHGALVTTVSGPAISAPVYLRLTRNGNVITGQYSSDNESWTTVGSYVTSTTPVMPNLYYTGFVTSSTTASQNTAVFKYVSYNVSVPQPAANLLGFYRSDVGVVSAGGLVSQWSDVSGNNNHAIGTGTTKPTLTTGAINSAVLPTITFGGSQSLALPTGFANLTGGAYIVCVLKPTSATLTCDPVFLGNASNSDALYLQSIGKQASLSSSNGTTSSAVTTTTNPLSNTAYSLLEATLKPGLTAGTGTGTLYVNGVQIVQATNLQNLNNISRTQNFIGVGAGSANYFQGGIAELLIYSSPPTSSQMASLRAYILSKYNIGVQPTLDAPVFSNGSGVYVNAQQISIAQGQGATSYFTINGATPSTGVASQWFNNIPLQLYSGTETVKAIAVSPFFTNSPIASATYQVDENSQPLTRNGLVLWLTNSGIATSGSAVTSWQDSSGSGNTATQTTSGNRPTLVPNALNGLPAVAFNGTSQYLQLPGGFANFTSGASIFAMIKPTGVTAGARILDLGNGATSDNLQLQEPASSSAALYVYNGATPSSVTSSSAITLNQFQLLEAIDTGSGSATILTNGVPGATGSSIATLNNLLRSNCYVGQGSAGGNYFKGQIAELLIFNRAVTASEQASIEGLMLSKYQAAALNTTPAPKFSVAAGALTAPSQVAIEAPAAANILFSTDGSAPSQPYVGPVTIAWSQTLKAVAVVNGVSSAVTSAAYTLPTTQFPAPASSTTPLQINLQLPSVSIPQDSAQH